jgi:hypothetical protein
MNNKPSRTCLDWRGNEKRCWRTQEQAQIAASDALLLWGSKVEPYQCGRCGLWHLTSKTKSQ